MQRSREPPAAGLRQSLHPPWAPEQGLETRLSHVWEADGGPDASHVTRPSEHQGASPQSGTLLLMCHPNPHRADTGKTPEQEEERPFPHVLTRGGDRGQRQSRGPQGAP